MIDKYKDKFKEMYKRIYEGEGPIKVIGENMNIFEREGIGMIGIACYLDEYIRKKG